MNAASVVGGSQPMRKPTRGVLSAHAGGAQFAARCRKHSPRPLTMANAGEAASSAGAAASAAAALLACCCRDALQRTAPACGEGERCRAGVWVRTRAHLYCCRRGSKGTEARPRKVGAKPRDRAQSGAPADAGTGSEGTPQDCARAATRPGCNEGRARLDGTPRSGLSPSAPRPGSPAGDRAARGSPRDHSNLLTAHAGRHGAGGAHGHAGLGLGGEHLAGCAGPGGLLGLFSGMASPGR